MPVRLEDDAIDVWKKALRGTGKTPRDLAAATGLPLQEVRKVTRGLPEAAAVPKLAPLLDLDPASLHALASGNADPPELQMEGLIAITTPFPVPGYEEMTVNSYLLLPPQSKEAILFDAGAEAPPVLNAVRESGRTVRAIFLTHSHRDHVAALTELVPALGHPPVYLHHKEAHSMAGPVSEGDFFSFDPVGIEIRLTKGHSQGGCSFLISGMPQPLAVVGDALFARSIGGCPPAAYPTALTAIRQHLLTLPPQTLLCPGHGPLTSVAQECAHNPFFSHQF